MTAPCQLALPLTQTQAHTLTLVDVVRDIMRGSGWITFYEIQREVERRTGEWHSDSGISARKRDLSKPQFGAHTFDKRIREGTKSWEYRLLT